MKRWMGIAAACLLPAIVSAHAGETHPFPMVRFDRPMAAPGFTLDTLGRRSVRLSDYHGRFVLLNFWATWCPPCVQEMPSMDRLHRRLASRGLSVVAISQDNGGRDRVRAFARRLKLTFSIALDPQQAVGDAYGVRDLPSTFLISPDGAVVAAVKGGLDWDSPAALEFLDSYLRSGPQPGGLAASTP